MTGNVYEGVLKEREVALIRQWAKKAGYSPDEIPDVMQEVVMVLIQQPEGWPPPLGRSASSFFGSSPKTRWERSSGPNSAGAGVTSGRHR